MRFPIHIPVNSITEYSPTFRLCNFIVINKHIETKAVRNKSPNFTPHVMSTVFHPSTLVGANQGEVACVPLRMSYINKKYSEM